MKIKFRKHAKLKFGDLRRKGFRITERQVKGSLLNPDRVVADYLPSRFIAEKTISRDHKLRVVYEKHLKFMEIVTFYPTKRRRYEI